MLQFRHHIEIPESFTQRPILDVAREIGLEPAHDSGPWYTCLCPVHGDTTPSLRINLEGYWWCFGCAHGGDALELVWWIKKHRVDGFTRVDAYLEVVDDVVDGGANGILDRLADVGEGVDFGPLSLAEFARSIRGAPTETELRWLDAICLRGGVSPAKL